MQPKGSQFPSIQRPTAVPDWKTDWQGWVDHLDKRAAGEWMSSNTNEYTGTENRAGKVQN